MVAKLHYQLSLLFSFRRQRRRAILLKIQILSVASGDSSPDSPAGTGSKPTERRHFDHGRF
ncbi:hypothetical protein H6F61_26550 [Cyanobacteria bacterium FACHB-472]|nr:hypothetical protein [Cyanobacteria bacterium FACHB-472]